MSMQHRAANDRVVRVFVSSTFRDMHAERDELIKRIFPQIRKLCEERGVTWSEVDLRWGITEDESERGEVLPICLAEIQRSRPFFIGLLGERYGWVPDLIPAELIAQEPWLEQHRFNSVTELEILHGVLNNPAMAQHSFFYFRDPAFINSISTRDQTDYLELASAEEIERLGRADAERRTQQRKDKLIALKARIRESGLPTRENYPNPRALGELVLTDLTTVIDRLYPADDLPDRLDREALDHEGFALSRARVYIGRPEYFARLDRHVEDGGPPLVVVGDSGAGKSALLGNWVLRYRKSHYDRPLLMHFVGATAESADWAAMLRRVMSELMRSRGIKLEIPTESDRLRSAFIECLDLAADEGGACLVFDALNQLEDRDGAPDLTWLPSEIPPKIRVIVSALPGRSLDELASRGWPTLRIEPLQPEERQQLIKKYLDQYAKHLSPERVGRIARARQAANPLYLRALLDELRVFGIHEQLDARIEDYLGARTPDKLYQKILERYEQDYERERPGLVSEAMSMIWGSRRGLSETELLELLGSNQQPLPRAYWSPLFLAVEQSLVSRSGLMGFGHDFLRNAVRTKYLRTKSQRTEAHKRLADYFIAQAQSNRRIEELPWQLAEAGQWHQLKTLLTEREFFTRAWKTAQFDVSAYWARIEEGSTLRLIGAYDSWLNESDKVEDFQPLADVFSLLSRAGHQDESRRFYVLFAEHMSKVSESAGFQYPPGMLADAMLARGRVDEAMRLYKEQEDICRKFGNFHTLQLVLGDQVQILLSRGDNESALPLSEEQEQICRELLVAGGPLARSIKSGLERSLGHQAIIFCGRGEFDKAMRLADEQERLCRESADLESLQGSLGVKAEIQHGRGDWTESLRLYKEQEKVCRQIGSKKLLAQCLADQAAVLRAQGNPDEAARLRDEQEKIERSFDDKAGIAGLLERANELFDHNRMDEATEVLHRCEAMSREANDERGLAETFGYQANIACSTGRHAEAMRLFKAGEAIWRKLDDKDGLQTNLGNQSVLLNALGRLDEALDLCREQERLCHESGNKVSLQQSLGNQGVILRAKGNLDEAGRLYEKQERICRDLDYRPGLVLALINQGSLLANEKGQPRAGLPLAEAAYNLAVDNDFTFLISQVEPVLVWIRKKIEEPQPPRVYLSTPHPNADADRASALNLQYQKELARWNALPWLKRMRTRKPEPPRGI